MRRLLALVLLVYLLGLARATLGPVSTPSGAVEKTAAQVDRATPSSGGESPQRTARRTTRERTAIDTAFNVLLFVPLGALVLGLWPSWRWWAVVGTGAALSVAIELSQRWFFTWRSEQLSDVVTNVLGTAIGWAVAAAVLHWRGNSSSGSRAAVSPTSEPG